MVFSAWQHLSSKLAGVDWGAPEYLQQMLPLPEELLQKKRTLELRLRVEIRAVNSLAHQ